MPLLVVLETPQLCFYSFFLQVRLHILFNVCFSPRETELSDALSEVASLKSEVSRMGEEKSDLMAKIEDGEGASTALKQLQQQNVREKIVFSKKKPQK